MHIAVVKYYFYILATHELCIASNVWNAHPHEMLFPELVVLQELLETALLYCVSSILTLLIGGCYQWCTHMIVYRDFNQNTYSKWHHMQGIDLYYYLLHVFCLLEVWPASGLPPPAFIFVRSPSVIMTYCMILSSIPSAPMERTSFWVTSYARHKSLVLLRVKSVVSSSFCFRDHIIFFCELTCISFLLQRCQVIYKGLIFSPSVRPEIVRTKYGTLHDLKMVFKLLKDYVLVGFVFLWPIGELIVPI